MKTRIVIPARLESSRLPKKLIQKINGKSLIEHVCLRAKKIKTDSLIVATDSKEIQEIVKKINIDCWFSKNIFLNGTHRIAFLSKRFKYNKNDIVINIQADEFNFSLNGVSKLIDSMKRFPQVKVATLIYRNNKKIIHNDKNSVKVLIDREKNAFIFSRCLIPFNNKAESLIHIGIYAYRVDVLNSYINLSISPYEKYEKLEQLRFLWNNIKIKCILLKNNKSVSVNSLKDLRIARKFKA